MKNNRKWIILGIVGIVLVIAVVVFVVLSRKPETNFGRISDMFLRFYSDEGVVEMNSEEVFDKLGMRVREGDEKVVLGNFVIGDENAGEIEEPIMILYVENNDRKVIEEKYEALENFLTHIGENEDNYGEKNVELSMKAILQREGNYLYFLVGNDAELLERELLTGGLKK